MNKKVGRQLYKYALGAWKRLFKDLRALGWSAGMLAEKIRIRYYEGMESSCLLNKPIHKFEDCLKCPLFQLYHKEWRRVYRFPVPVMDPVILKLSGYCPFQVLFNPVFWRNSIVIINYKLLPLVAPILSRLKLKHVVVYFDEYLIQMMRREKLFKLDEKWYEKLLNLEIERNGKVVKFRDVIRKWNAFVDRLYSEIVKKYEEIGYEIYRDVRKDEIGLWRGFLQYLKIIATGDVDLVDVGKKLVDVYREICGMLDKFYDRYKLAVFRRLRRYLSFVWNSFGRAEFDGYGYSLKFVPELWLDGVYSSVGGYIFSFIWSLQELRDRGVKVSIITSSVDDSDVGGVNLQWTGGAGFATYNLRMISPGLDFKYVRISLEYRRSVVYGPSYPYSKDPVRVERYVRSLRNLYEELKRINVNVAVVVDRDSMLYLAEMFRRENYDVYYARDPERHSVVDYVVVRKPSGKIVLLFHPHGRVAIGVDPPYRDFVEAVVVSLGVRSYPRYLVPIPSVFRGVVRDLQGCAVTIDDVEGVYAVVYGDLLFVYDVFSKKYDLHMLVQVVGRFFLSQSMKFLALNPRFGVRELRFFLLIGYWEKEEVKSVAGMVWRVKYVNVMSRKVYENDFELRKSGDDLLNVVMDVEPISISRFFGSVPGVRKREEWLVNLNRVRYAMYNMLKNAYNSLRYCRTQLRYGRQPDRWWLVKKLVYLINGFIYARLEGMPVPDGLKRVYRKFVSEGLGKMLEYLKERYLQGIDPGVWKFIRRYTISFTRRMGWLV